MKAAKNNWGSRAHVSPAAGRVFTHYTISVYKKAIRCCMCKVRSVDESLIDNEKSA